MFCFDLSYCRFFLSLFIYLRIACMKAINSLMRTKRSKHSYTRLCWNQRVLCRLSPSVWPWNKSNLTCCGYFQWLTLMLSICKIGYLFSFYDTAVWKTAIHFSTIKNDTDCALTVSILHFCFIIEYLLFVSVVYSSFSNWVTLSQFS